MMYTGIREYANTAKAVTPAQAGIQLKVPTDTGLRRYDASLVPVFRGQL